MEEINEIKGYKFEKLPPDWCDSKIKKELPLNWTKKRAEMAMKNGTLENTIWSVKTLPKFKKGPIDFVYKM